MLQFIQRLLGRSKPPPPPFDFTRNRYLAKKTWPPNLRNLTEKQQFRFERKYKRRLLLKSWKPQWQKWTKVIQWGLISFIVVHGVLFYDFAKDPMNPQPGEQPFKWLRGHMWGWYDSLWTHNSLPRGREGEKERRVESENEEEQRFGVAGGEERQRVGRS